MDSQTYLDLVRKMYEHPKRYGFFTKDEISDALNNYRNRIELILERAENESRTKDAYLLSSMRYVAKSVHRQNYNLSLCETAYIYSNFTEELAIESPVEPWTYYETINDATTEKGILNLPPKVILDKLSPAHKRLLFLTMKCAWEIDEELLSRCSLSLGIPREYLFNLIELTKRRTERGWNKAEQMNIKLHALWIRLRVLEFRLETCLLNEEKEYILCSLKRCRERYARLLEKRCHRRSAVSNESISQILGVPKGSIDSGLFYLRKHVDSGRSLEDYRKLG
ncbi:MAG TPA: hypothetical protein PK105_01085 [Rectinema sp.]|jgi:hypothetical protein|nr:hypothetical protein [Spirochaetia bacterium]MDI9427757.1 hypothetical protein [Spirochaetota bacterium]NLH89725.1 hypothetical protein [Treponema sp.]OQC75160.1 MAG: hypothetical protein BWX44_00181 [Spirochaetes bacterium ADurb.Bin001]HNP92686.1 hypothetical protein [Rectinema sp.]